MHIVAIAWIFVVVLMAAAEATSPQGTVLGAFFTLLLYGALPLGIVMYILGTPGRKRLRREAEAQALAEVQAGGAEASAAQPAAGPSAGDGNGRAHAAGQPVAPKREEP